MNSFEMRVGDARALLPLIPDASVQCVVTSPPYWGLRDYGMADQLGLEATPEAYIEGMVAIFREVRRVLAKDGTLWLNMGDGYTAGGRGGDTGKSGLEGSTTSQDESKRARGSRSQRLANGRGDQPAVLRRKDTPAPPWAHAGARGLKPKDLCMMPHRLAIALQADGWCVRSDIVWAKPNPMPESVADRPTKSHEYLFLLSKSRRYFYDADAVREPLTTNPRENYPARARITGRGEQSYNGEGARKNDRDKSGGFPPKMPSGWDAGAGHHESFHHNGRELPKRGAPTGWGSDPDRVHRDLGGRFEHHGTHPYEPMGRNLRSVWTIATAPFAEAHFATFPPKLVEPCVKAGTRPGDLVFDPFAGAGTVGLVALRLGRDFLGLELNPAYAEMARRRILEDSPLLNAETQP